MLSEDVIEKGYALMCVSVPTSDCTVEEITEEEILDQQLCA
jgi:ferredoxin